MAVQEDVLNLLNVFLVNNLSSIANDRRGLQFPMGFQAFIQKEVVNNVEGLQFPSDLREIFVNYILVQEQSNPTRLERANPMRHAGIKKQRREFFR